MTPFRCSTVCVFIVLCLAVIFPTGLLAQGSDARITGIVTDQSKAAIRGAQVVAINQDTGVSYRARTNSSGIYLVPSILPGSYRVEVQSTGFKSIIKPGLTLHVQDAAEINFEMAVGSASESVTVSDEGIVLNTTDASVSTVIDRKFVENIPLNGRSFQDLISMTPGVVTQSPQASSSLGYNGDFSVNGQRTESNSYTVDGVSGNTGAGNGYGGGQAGTGGGLPASTALGTTQSLISVDALQEFRVQSSSYSAEFGRTPGGQFSLVTRSGTNAFHGTLFDFLRNDYFDANDWFNNNFGLAKPALRQNDFGGTIGGPVLFPGVYNGLNRTFFFASYEGLRLTQPQAASLDYVPSLNLRTNALSGLEPILNGYPLPTSQEIQIPCDGVNVLCPPGSPVGTSAPSGLSPFTKAFSLPAHLDSTSVRVDHVFHPKLTLFARYGDTPSVSSTRDFSAVTGVHFDTRTYTLGAVSQLSNRFSNDFRLGFSQSATSVSTVIDGFGGATPVDLPTAFGAGGHPYAEPYLLIFVPGVGLSNLAAANSSNISHQWNATDAFSMSAGHHQLKFGIDVRHINSPLNPSSPLIEAVYESTQSLFTNQATLLELSNRVSADPIFKEVGAFAQDEWHVAPNVSLSLGVRWELHPSPQEAHGDDAFTLQGSIGEPNTLALAPRGTPLWKTTYYNFAPRLGVAWQAHTTPGWETVVRSGGGVFYDTDNQLATQGFSGIGFSALSVLPGASLPVTPAQLNFSPSTAAPYTSSPIYAFPAHLQLPYTLQWNVSLQQALGKDENVTVSYVGSSGRRLLAEQEISLTAVNPEFGTVFYVPSNVTSNYQALQVRFQRSLRRGIQALASYTWSHSIDLGSSATALPLQRADSDFDVRSNFSGGLSWDLPNLNRGRASDLFLSHWGLDGRLIARTGFPITLNGNLLTDPGTGNQFYSGVNLVAGQTIYLHDSSLPGGRSLNAAAFSLPSGTDVGDFPRNFARGFGETQINLAARHDFPLREHLVLQFRAEAFNLLNHPNFGVIDTNLTDATFGQATQMLNQSLGTIASQYQQGGPRSMQFALKLVF